MYSTPLYVNAGLPLYVVQLTLVSRQGHGSNAQVHAIKPLSRVSLCEPSHSLQQHTRVGNHFTSVRTECAWHVDTITWLEQGCFVK